AMDWLLGDRLDPVVAEPRLRTSDGLEQLRTGGARLADDVERLVAPMGRHLATSRVGVLGGTDRREQHLGGGHAQAETERTVAIVGVEPVVRGTEGPARRDKQGILTGDRDLEENLVLSHEQNLLVVDSLL